MYIGRGKGNLTNWKKMNADAEKILQNLGIPARANQQLSDCSIAIQQMVAIARAVDMDCKVLILDEPTSSLDESEVEKLFGLMRDLKARGVGIIFVTHFLDQVYEVCDKITVLRDGQLVGEYVIEDLPRVKLVAKMLGKEMVDMADIKSEAKPMRVAMSMSFRQRACRVTRASSPLISILRRVRSTALPACLVPAEASACVPCSPQTM